MPAEWTKTFLVASGKVGAVVAYIVPSVLAPLGGPPWYELGMNSAWQTRVYVAGGCLCAASHVSGPVISFGGLQLLTLAHCDSGFLVGYESGIWGTVETEGSSSIYPSQNARTAWSVVSCTLYSGEDGGQLLSVSSWRLSQRKWTSHRDLG